MKQEDEMVGSLHPAAVHREFDSHLHPPKLDELALRHGTDKSSAHHNYTPIYDDLFWLRRYDHLTLLELGVFTGDSIRMWAEYFPNGKIIGVDKDLDQFAGVCPANVELLADDQANPDLTHFLDRFRGPLDIIIDDASHLSSLTIKSFELLFPILAPGGYYVVEDTHSSYHQFFYGSTEANPNPEGPTLFGGPTALQYFKRVADDVNFDPTVDGDRTLFPRRYWKGFHLKSVTFMYDLVIIQKAGKWSPSGTS